MNEHIQKLDWDLMNGKCVDLRQLCRLCVSNLLLVPLFKGDGIKYEFVTKIQRHLGVNVKDVEGMSPHICTECARLLMSWDRMLATSMIANMRLRHCVNAPKPSTEICNGIACASFASFVYPARAAKPKKRRSEQTQTVQPKRTIQTQTLEINFRSIETQTLPPQTTPLNTPALENDPLETKFTPHLQEIAGEQKYSNPNLAPVKREPLDYADEVSTAIAHEENVLVNLLCNINSPQIVTSKSVDFIEKDVTTNTSQVTVVNPHKEHISLRENLFGNVNLLDLVTDKPHHQEVPYTKSILLKNNIINLPEEIKDSGPLNDSTLTLVNGGKKKIGNTEYSEYRKKQREKRLALKRKHAKESKVENPAVSAPDCTTSDQDFCTKTKLCKRVGQFHRTPVPPFKCETCGKKYRGERRFKSHLESHHIKRKSLRLKRESKRKITKSSYPYIRCTF